uniref:DC-UbP/UBTD2 N-terminal domain-containing protein n=1 Tax=Aegilops tauschii TaxID=37682 RepID=M8BLR7_AEGTA
MGCAGSTPKGAAAAGGGSCLRAWQGFLSGAFVERDYLSSCDLGLSWPSSHVIAWIKLRGFFGLVCNFTSWLLFLCAKASVLLFVQFCQKLRRKSGSLSPGSTPSRSQLPSSGRCVMSFGTQLLTMVVGKPSTEIWDALRAASEADVALAQAIVESAGVIVSNADLTLCYDERDAKNNALLECPGNRSMVD